MSAVCIHGWGAVSPAGWGAGPLWEAVQGRRVIDPVPIPWPGRDGVFPVRKVPVPAVRAGALAHPRLRRASPISQFAVAAAMEALGAHQAIVTAPSFRLGIVCCIFTGCIAYSRRFYGEVLQDPSTASPMVFPETVFNAPSSHLGAVLGARAANYTLVGDEGEFLKGMALAAQWLAEGVVDGCLVVGAEEADPISCDAMGQVARGVVVGEGAGAVFMSLQPGAIELGAVTSPEAFMDRRGRLMALARTRRAWEGVAAPGSLLVGNDPAPAWGPWASPAGVLGEGLGAAGAWQAVAAAEALARGASPTPEVVVETAGSNEQVVAAVLRRTTPVLPTLLAGTIELDGACLLDLLPQSLPSQLHRPGLPGSMPS